MNLSSQRFIAFILGKAKKYFSKKLKKLCHKLLNQVDVVSLNETQRNFP